MIAVLFDPVDGRITQTVQGEERNLAAAGVPFLEVDELRDDYDVTHRVVDGRLVAR